jgi:hypothetical protein
MTIKLPKFYDQHYLSKILMTNEKFNNKTQIFRDYIHSYIELILNDSLDTLMHLFQTITNI